MIDALVRRNDSSMASFRLRQLFTLDHEAQDAFHEMVDVASEVPSLLEQTDVLIASRDIIPMHMWGNIFDSSLLVLEKLYGRNEKLRAERERVLYWAVPSSARNPADDAYGSKLFPFALEYESLATASSMIFLWATVIQVLVSMMDLYEHFFGDFPTFDEPKPRIDENPKLVLNSRFPTIASVKDEADRLARQLCQSIEYCYKMENGVIGPQMTCYVQWVLGLYFRKFHYQREIAWWSNIRNMTGPGFRHGIELMTFLNGISGHATT